MAINETIATGRKFRKLIDEVNKIWQRISFWTKAEDVEFNDGSTAEIKIGTINGVTDSLTSTASNVAASAAAVKALNDKVTAISSNLKHLPELEVVEGTVPIGTNMVDVGKQIVAVCTGIADGGIPGGGSVYITTFCSGNFSVNMGQSYTDVSQHPYAVVIDGTKFYCGSHAAGVSGYRKYVALVVK